MFFFFQKAGKLTPSDFEGNEKINATISGINAQQATEEMERIRNASI